MERPQDYGAVSCSRCGRLLVWDCDCQERDEERAERVIERRDERMPYSPWASRRHSRLEVFAAVQVLRRLWDRPAKWEDYPTWVDAGELKLILEAEYGF